MAVPIAVGGTKNLLAAVDRQVRLVYVSSTAAAGPAYGPEASQLMTAGSVVDFLHGPAAFYCGGGTAISHVDDDDAGIVAALTRGSTGDSRCPSIRT